MTQWRVGEIGRENKVGAGKVLQIGKQGRN